MKNLIWGILGFTMAIVLMVGLFYVFPYKPLVANELVAISGRLSYVRNDGRLKSADKIYIKIGSSKVSYKVDGDFAQGKLDQLQVGALAKILVAKNDVETPRVNKITKEVWLPIVSLTVNNQSVITLEEFNSQDLKLRKVFKWFGPLFALGSLWMIWDGISSLKKKPRSPTKRYSE